MGQVPSFLACSFCSRAGHSPGLTNSNASWRGNLPPPPSGVLSRSPRSMDVFGEGPSISFQERQPLVEMRRVSASLLAQTLASSQATHQRTPSLRVRSRSPGHTGSGRSHPYCHRSHGSHTRCHWHIHLCLRDNGDQGGGHTYSLCLLGVLFLSGLLTPRFENKQTITTKTTPGHSKETLNSNIPL